MALIPGLLLALQEQPAAQAEMTSGGWVFMACAWLFILTLVIYTFSKILRGS